MSGLDELWLCAVGGGAMTVPTRPLLDSLGLGLEQTLQYLAVERPAFPEFLAWITQTAGAIDADRIARYEAWRRGAPLPSKEAARQASLIATPPVFDDEDLASWERDGVIVLRNAIDRDEAAAIADVVWQLVGAHPEEPDSWYGPRSNGIMLQHFQHPAMEVPRRSGRIARAFADIYGHADLIASIDRLSFNPPVRNGYRFPGPHLHWDGSLASPIPFETQGILYLTDTAANQGALQVVRGFHHRLSEGWLNAALGDPRAIDLSEEAETVAAGAGDLIIWRHEIPHGASPNHGVRPRLAQYINYYPMRGPDLRPWL